MQLIRVSEAPPETPLALSLEESFAARLKRIGGGQEPAQALSSGESIGASRATWRSWRARYTALLVGADLMAALAATVVCWFARPSFAVDRVDVLGARLSYPLLAAIFLIIWPTSLLIAGAYQSRYPAVGLRDYRIPLVTAAQLMAAAAIGAFSLKAPLSRALVLTFFPVLMVSALITRWTVRQVLTANRNRGRAMNRVVLVGSLPSVYKIAEYLERNGSLGYEIAGICVPLSQYSLAHAQRGLSVLGAPDDIVEAAQTARADSVIVAARGRFDKMSLQQASWQLEDNGIGLFVAPVVELAGPRIRATAVAGMPLLHIAESRVGGPGRHFKPIYERLLGLALLVVSTPVMLVIGLAVLLDSGRPIFYRQRRVGYVGKEFSMIKFRTMVPNADQLLAGLRKSNEYDGALFKIRDDPRVTRVGRFLRRHSLDELPQLINVLKGDMVLVGPRPCLATEAVGFTEAAQRRFLARPGLTGLWQISGRSDLAWDEAVQLDLYYVENWSPLLDLMILWRTFRVVLGGQGAY